MKKIMDEKNVFLHAWGVFVFTHCSNFECFILQGLAREILRPFFIQKTLQAVTSIAKNIKLQKLFFCIFNHRVLH